MAYRIVLPEDTARQIDEFIERRCANEAAALSVADALDVELEKLAANPMLGAQQRGTPFGTRRIHQFMLTVADSPVSVQFIYAVNEKTQAIVASGFDELRIVL